MENGPVFDGAVSIFETAIPRIGEKWPRAGRQTDRGRSRARDYPFTNSMQFSGAQATADCGFSPQRVRLQWLVRP